MLQRPRAAPRLARGTCWTRKALNACAPAPRIATRLENLEETHPAPPEGFWENAAAKTWNMWLVSSKKRTSTSGRSALSGCNIYYLAVYLWAFHGVSTVMRLLQTLKRLTICKKRSFVVHGSELSKLLCMFWGFRGLPHQVSNPRMDRLYSRMFLCRQSWPSKQM